MNAKVTNLEFDTVIDLPGLNQVPAKVTIDWTGNVSVEFRHQGTAKNLMEVALSKRGLKLKSLEFEFFVADSL